MEVSDVPYHYQFYISHNVLKEIHETTCLRLCEIDCNARPNEEYLTIDFLAYLVQLKQGTCKRLKLKLNVAPYKGSVFKFDFKRYLALFIN